MVRLPLWVYRITVGRLLSKRSPIESEEQAEEAAPEAAENDGEDSEPGRPTPSSGSAEDFEMLEKSVDELGRAKASGNNPKGSKVTKRKNKKR